MRVRVDLSYGWICGIGIVAVTAISGCQSSSSGSSPVEDAAAAPDAGGIGLPADPIAADAAAGPNADAGGCHPINVSGFRPPPAVSARARSHACDGFNGDGGLVPSYGDDCLGVGSTYASCAAFALPDAAGAAECYGCLVTPETPDASSYGVVAVAPIAVVDYAGCIQMVDPTDAGASCAREARTAYACDEYACKSTCPVTDDKSLAALTACMNEASSGGCAGYYLPAQACVAAEQGQSAVANICFGGSQIEGHYLAFANYACGGD
jgi:hypothetical protein